MTREEAIERIKDHIEIHRYHERTAVKIFEAFDMAIKALEQSERKGKWIVYEVANTEEEQPIAWECDACGAVMDCKTRFCPECGNEKEV